MTEKQTEIGLWQRRALKTLSHTVSGGEPTASARLASRHCCTTVALYHVFYEFVHGRLHNINDRTPTRPAKDDICVYTRQTTVIMPQFEA